MLTSLDAVDNVIDVTASLPFPEPESPPSSLDEQLKIKSANNNDLKIIESSATKIVFFLDGTIEESYIITSSNDGKITNTFRINVIGKIDYDK